MASSVVISFKDIDAQDKVRDAVEKRCEALAEEFPETTRYELTLQADANSSFEASCHVTGKKTSTAAHINSADNARQAGDQVLDKLVESCGRTTTSGSSRRGARRRRPRRSARRSSGCD